MENKKRLIFGDPESIKIRDDYARKTIEKELLEKVKCPFCKAKATDCFSIDLKEDWICFNFACKKDCPNSIEYGEKYGFDDAECCFTLKGKFIKE